MHKVLVNRLGGLSLPRKSVVRLTDRPDMTLDVYSGRKTTMQQQQLFLDFSDVLSCRAPEQGVCVCVWGGGGGGGLRTVLEIDVTHDKNLKAMAI